MGDGAPDAYFGKVLRGSAKGTRLARAQALKTYFLFLELRHKIEIHNLTSRVVECPIGEMNRPRGRKDAALRIPPSADQVGRLFAGWREELASCRKFAPTARNSRGSGPRERMVPLINDARQTLCWFVEDVWSHFDDDHTRPGAPLFPSERRNADGTSARVGDEALRAALVDAATRAEPAAASSWTWHSHTCESNGS